MKGSRVRLLVMSFFTVGLIAVILLATWVTTEKINEMAQERCFDELADEAYEMGEEIEQKIEANRRQLELIASVAADYDDLTDPDFWSKAKGYVEPLVLSRIEILLPGDKVVLSDGSTVDVGGKMSFAEEAAKGEHVSDREEDVTGGGNWAVRHYVPVVRGGETVALLYGVAVLSDMPAQLTDQPYDGKAAVYIIDGANGDLLMDTWHNTELGNMWEFGGREMAPGYDDEQLQAGVATGESNYVVFVSKTIGSYLYFYYTPIAVNQWVLALSVPEDVVFEHAQNIHDVMDKFLLVEVLCFMACIAGMLCYVRLEMRDKRRQVMLLNRIYEVERLLFNAHENSDQVSGALEQVTDMMQAEQVSCWLMTQPGYDVTFSWSRPGSAIKEREFSTQRENAYRLIRYFDENKKDYYSGPGAPLLEQTAEHGVHNVLAIPVMDPQSGICGILAAFNLTEEEDSLTLLRSLGVSFGMFCNNMRSYQSVKEQGERDLLTGLYNRNRYELEAADCRGWYQKTLACIYVDANGLHELNNSKGHAEGDRMLQTIAGAMEKYFGDLHTYRIGGDEFLAFAPDKSEAAVRQLAAQCEEEVRQAGYCVSIGVELAEDVDRIEALVEAAEKKMYAAKRAYYATHDRRCRQ